MFAKVRRSQREAISYAQMLINIMSGTKLKTDGLVGPATRLAYSQLAPTQKTLVANHMTSSGHNVQLLELNAQSPSIPSSASHSRRELEKMIVAEARKHGVHPNLALTVVNVESRFNPRAVSDTGASGLFQLTNIAIDDVVLHAGGPLYGFTKQTEAHRRHVKTNVEANITYGVLYLKRTCQLLRNRGVNVYPSSSKVSDWAMIYAGYNIGAAAVKTILDMQEGKKVSDSRIAGARKSLAPQAADLKKDGLSGYLTNATQWIASQVV